MSVLLGLTCIFYSILQTIFKLRSALENTTDVLQIRLQNHWELKAMNNKPCFRTELEMMPPISSGSEE